MDVKDSRTETALSERNNDGTKYSQGGVALQCNRNKSYQDIGSNPLGKAEPTPVRPCAVIGPDRVVPPPITTNDPFLKKGPLEPWLSPDVYRRPPEYPHKLSSQNPSRNISPRQTFQENMQRIMVPPTYNIARHNDEANFNHVQDRNIVSSKNVKPNMASEAMYSDVPYTNTLANEPKKDTEMYVPSVNPPLTRTASHGWPPNSVNIHAPRTYAAHELYQYPQYPQIPQTCAGPRPTVIPMSRPHRTIQDDAAYGYPEHYYQDARFKPYAPVKERYPQPRYEYMGSYPNQFHPQHQIQPQKYDISKSGSSHPYSMYPHVKYLENRVPDHHLEGYQRPTTNQQLHYNLQFRNQVIHPTYTPVLANSAQNKIHPYPPDGSVKTLGSNKLHFDNNSKMYIDYENARAKAYSTTDNYFVNEMSRVHPGKNQMVMPNYSSIGIHPISPQQYYRKEHTQMKPFEYMPHFRNSEAHLNNNTLLRHAPQFSPNTLAISPTDSNISNDTSQTHGSSQDDCGYVSQSSTASLRSMDSSIYRLPHEYYKRYDYRYGPIVGSSPTLIKSDLNSNNVNSKDNKQKQIDVRQFLQMWNEGEEENNCENNNAKDIVIQTGSSDMSTLQKQHLSSQDQLYVLGLVNVPSEELSKYDHIQKISKLPENIKGYNSLELLSQFEEAIESSNKTNFKSIPKEYQAPLKESSTKQAIEVLSRPLSPLDVEAKISQSVIHKEVGCNFEIRPCSPKMLNVEVAAPAQKILGERAIEKVTNPLSHKVVKSPVSIKPDGNSNCHTMKRQDNSFTMNDNPSCKMVRSPYASNNMDSVKTNYSLHDLEINSGVCLASLPRLDNEIELNFPEVNQQFINANKKDSTIQNCSPRNSVEEPSLSESKLGKISVEKDDLIEDSDKTFTKLSKYRKVKVNTSNHSENNEFAKVVRTDSVIIKNPENIKNIEDKLLENHHNLPINLSSQSSVSHELTVKQCDNNAIDIALDFSLNKSGNDLPVIAMEKEELPKLFGPHLPHDISCNIAPADFCESSSKITGIDSNNTSDIDIDLNKNDDKNCHETDVKNDAQHTIKSVIEENVTDILDLNNTHSANVKCESTACENQQIDHSNSEHVNNNVKKRIIDDLDTCKEYKYMGSKKYDTGEDTASKDNVCNESELENCILLSPQLAKIPKSEESEGQNQCPENKYEVDVNKLVISTHNDNDFEHDEISASLEKLFQEDNEETKVLISDDSSLDVSLSIPLKTHCFQQSKELYSPWIQKLLIHSEGRCKVSHNGEYKRMQISTNKVIEGQVQSMDIDHDNKTQGLSQHLMTAKDVFDNKITEKITSHMKCIPQCESSVIDFQPNAVSESTKNISGQEIKTNIEKECSEKSSNKWINDKIIKTEFNFKVEKSATNHSRLKTTKTLHESVHELIKCDSVISSAASIDDKIESSNCEAYAYVEEECCEHSRKNNHDAENKSKEDSRVPTLKNLSNYILNNTKCHTPRDLTREKLMESSNVMENSDKKLDPPELLDTDNKVHNNYSAISEDDLTKCKSVMHHIVSDTCIEQTTDRAENQGTKFFNLCFDRHNDSDNKPDIFKRKNGIQEDRYNTGPEYDSERLSEICAKHQTNANPDEETITKNYFPQKPCSNAGNTIPMQTLESNIVQADLKLDQEKLSLSVSNSAENQERKYKIENHLIEDCDIEKTREIIKTFNRNSVIQEDLKNTSILVAPENKLRYNCAEYQNKYCQEEQNEMKNGGVENRCNDLGKILGTFKSNGCGQEDHVDPDNYVASQTKENVNKEKIANNDAIGNNDNNTFISNNIAEQNHYVSGTEILSKITCGNIADYKIKDHPGQNDIDKNRRNSSGAIFPTLNSTNISQKYHKHAPRSSSNSATDKNYYDQHQTKEKLSEVSRIESEGRDNDSIVKLKTIENQNISKFDENVLDRQSNSSKMIKIENNISSSGPKCSINEIQNTISSINVFNDGHKIIETTLKHNNVLQQDQNDVTPEIPSDTVFGDNNCAENQSKEFVNRHSFIKNMNEACDKEETSVSDNLVHESLSQSNDKDHDNTTSPNTEYSNVCAIGQNKSNSASLSNNMLNCTENQTEKNEFRERLQENVINNLDRDTRETSETFHCGKIDRESFVNKAHTELVDLVMKTSSNSNFDQFNYDESQVKTCSEYNNTDKSTVMLSVCDSKINISAPDSLIQINESKHTLENLPNGISDRSTYHRIEEKHFLNENDIGASDINISRMQCEIVTESEENNSTKLENNTSNTDSREYSAQNSPLKSKPSLKRSFSDSALNCYKNRDASDRQIVENTPLLWPSKRPKICEVDSSQHVIEENFCSFIHNNRRNSISSFYNGDNVSFCILIDNDCIITEENEEEKMCFAQISEDCITEINTGGEEDNVGEIICCSEETELDFSDSLILQYDNEKSIQESWLDDVACVETVVSDDIEDVVNSEQISPKSVEVSEYDDCDIFNSTFSEFTDEINLLNDETVFDSVCQTKERSSSHVKVRRMLYEEDPQVTEEVNFLNGEPISDNVSQIEETYTIPHGDVEMLYEKEPQETEFCNVLNSGNCFEKIFSESNSREGSPSPTRVIPTDHSELLLLPDGCANAKTPENKENIFVENLTLRSYGNYSGHNSGIRENRKNMNVNFTQTETSTRITHDDIVQSSESSTDTVFSYKNDDDVDYTTSSSPEVSSTTFEEKSSSILLKITNYNGSRVSEINEINCNRPRCKFTEEQAYSSTSGSFQKRPLITKAAQKYIPPLKESICDLKVKLPLPKHKLLKLKQLKLSISKPKIMKQSNPLSKIPNKPKLKPNFEDVLKNIDKVQIKMHKEKSKKGKNIIPKVVIKKNLNGSHYTSSPNKDSYNPDLTGRKWQPWVFLEKNNFIDNMAAHNKTKAIFSHRKNTYVLAEKFKKYKSVSNCSAKFIISQPKTGNSSRGQLKYTIRLKHTY